MSEEKKTKKSRFKEWLNNKPKHVAVLSADSGLFLVKGYKLDYTPKGRIKAQKYNTKGMAAYLESGVAQNSHVSKGAVGLGALGGAVLLGPVGAVAGGLLGSAKRKGGTNLFLVIRDSEERPIITAEFKAKDEIDVRKFVETFNASATDPENEGEVEE